MKKCLKLLCITLLVAALMSSVLIGCSNSSTNTSDNSTPKEEQQGSVNDKGDKTEEEDPLAKYQPIEGKEYVFTMTPYQNAPVEENAKMVKLWEEKFSVKFDIWNIERAQYEEIMNVRMASGEIPDYIYASAGMIRQWVNQDVLAEIPEEVLKRFAPDAYKIAIEAEPNVFKIGRVDGKLYGLCRVPSQSASVRYGGAVWRGDWLENVGISKVPDTLEEFEEAFYKFSQNDPNNSGRKDTYGLSASGMRDIAGAYGLGGNSWFGDAWIKRDGDVIYNSEDVSSWVKKPGKIVYSAVQPEMKEVLRLFSKWYQDGVLDPEFITGENTGGAWDLSHTFVNGRIGFTGHGGGWRAWNPPLMEGGQSGGNYTELKNINPEAADKLVHGTLATGPDGHSGTYWGGTANPVIGNIHFAFGAHLEDEPDKFGKLLSVMNDILYNSMGTLEESFVSHWYGIQGEDWEYHENGAIKAIGEAAEDTSYMTRQGGHHIFNFLGLYQDDLVYDPLLDWARKNHYDQGVVKRAVPGGTLVDSQGRYGTELTAMQQEAFISIVTGDKPLDHFDEFVENWYNSGGLEIENDLNKWFNEFWE